MKPVKFEKVTKKYINDKIKSLSFEKKESKLLYEFTINAIREKKLFLKNMQAINYFLGKDHLEISFYTEDRYFTKELSIWRDRKVE